MFTNWKFRHVTESKWNLKSKLKSNFFLLIELGPWTRERQVERDLDRVGGELDGVGRGGQRRGLARRRRRLEHGRRQRRLH